MTSIKLEYDFYTCVCIFLFSKNVVRFHLVAKKRILLVSFSSSAHIGRLFKKEC